MIHPHSFLSHLSKRDFNTFTGVPCSYFTSVIENLENQKNNSYIKAPNEGSALALAAGYFLGGKSCAVMIQNSGLGNMINPLTSLCIPYRIPVLIFISGRAYGIPDEPQHEIMGKQMTAIFDLFETDHWDLPKEEAQFAAVLDEAIETMKQKSKPVAIIVKKGTFTPFNGNPSNASSGYPLKRADAISILLSKLEEDDLVFSTTGKTSRELFAAGDRPGNFYMQGSMGHIASIALGTAIASPSRRAVILDGDGSLLMHMGILSSVGHYAPQNFFHIVLDNESYESTGAQATTASNTDFAALAQGCGYRKTYKAHDEASLQQILSAARKDKGPVLLWVKMNSQSVSGVPRITSRYECPQITQSFQSFVAGVKMASRRS